MAPGILWLPYSRLSVMPLIRRVELAPLAGRPSATPWRDPEAHWRRARTSKSGDDLHLHQAPRRGPQDRRAGPGGGVMTHTPFSGPLAAELAGFTATLEAGASVHRATLTQLRALDRFVQEHSCWSGTIGTPLSR